MSSEDFRTYGHGEVAYVRHMTRAEFEARFKERWFAGNRKTAHIVMDASGKPRGWGASLRAAIYYAEEQGVRVQLTH